MMSSFFALALQNLGADWHVIVQAVDGADVIFAEGGARTARAAIENALAAGAPALLPFLDALRATSERVDPAAVGGEAGFVLKAHPALDGDGFVCVIESSGSNAAGSGAMLVDAVADAVRIADAAHDVRVGASLRDLMRGLPERPWAS